MSDVPAAGDSSLLRRLNTRAVLHLLRRDGAFTITHLAQASGLSRQTVEIVLEELAEAGWVTEVSRTEGVMGRPARRFAFRADAGYVIGVDVGVHEILAKLTDLAGDVVACERVTVPENLPATDRLSAVRSVTTACAERLQTGRLWAIAAAVPGIVDRSGRVILSTVVRGWSGLDLATCLGRWFDCAGLADNDTNAATLAEHWQGSAQHADDVVYVGVGRWSGVGILIGGRLHRGHTGGAGDAGLLRLLGCQDAYRDLFRTGEARDVFAIAARGDEEAMLAVDRFAAAIARCIAAVVLVVDPQLVLIGGFSHGGNVLLDPLRAHLALLCPSSAQRVAASTLGDDCIAMGAVRLALNHLDRQILESASPAVGSAGVIRGRNSRRLCGWRGRSVMTISRPPLPRWRGCAGGYVEDPNIS